MVVECEERYNAGPVGWSLVNDSDANTDDYRKAILAARTCPMFEVVGGEDGPVARFLRGEEPA